MKKRIASAALALLLIIGSPMGVKADIVKGSDDWSVTFNGDKMVNNFKTSDIDETINGMQPGDTAELHVAVKNSGTKATDWYLSNKIIQSLEDSVGATASGGAYSYRLAYVTDDGTTSDLYNSSTVGGDNTSAGQGLNEAGTQLEQYNYIFLDTLASGDSGEVILEVGLDGETQGNAYQSTLADLNLKFAVEEAATTNNTDNTPTVEPNKQPSRNAVKTGDNTNLMMLSIVALVSGLALMGIGVYRIVKKRRDSNEV